MSLHGDNMCTLQSYCIIVTPFQSLNFVTALQNYKESCRSIGYDCDSDTLYAECGNGKSGDDHAYLVTSIPDAAACESNLSNGHGVLVCRI